MPIGGIVSSLINSADPGRDGKQYLKENRDLWRGLETPDYEDIVNPYLQEVGRLNNESYDPQISGDFRGINEDPQAELMQLRNLGRLEDIAENGMPLQDRLAADEAQSSVAREGSRGRDQILADMRRRGRGGSGAELAAKLAGAGDQENAARGMGSDIAQQLLQRRMGAIGEMGNQSGQYRGQNIGKEAQISNMSNQYNQFLSNINTQAAANAARQRNLSQQYNLGNRQRIADSNVQGQLQGSQLRNQSLNQAFTDQYNKTQGQSNTMQALANQQNARQTQKQERVSQAGAGFDSAVGSIGGGLLSGGVK